MGTQKKPGRAAIFDRTVVYGGRGRSRKKPRPISLRKPMHVVLVSSHARGSRSFLSPGRPARIEATLKRLAHAFGVRILERGIRPDHVHLLMRSSERAPFQKFLRAFAGLLARDAAGAERGRPWQRPLNPYEKAGFKVKRLVSEGAGFWDGRPYTRILDTGRDLSSLRRQILLRALGTEGFTARRSRDRIEMPMDSA